MKFVICVQRHGDPFKMAARYVDRLRDSFARLGVDSVVLTAGDPGFVESIIYGYGRDPANVIYFAGFFYDMAVVADIALPRTHIAEFLPAKMIAMIGDHPFSNFMLRRVLCSHRAITHIGIDESYADELRLINPGLRGGRFAKFQNPLFFYDPSLAREHFGKREIDLFIPFSVKWNGGTDADAVRKTFEGSAVLSRFAVALFEAMAEDTNISPIAAFRNVLKLQYGLSADEFRKHTQRFFKCLSVLDVVDSIVRQKRRNEALRVLLRDVGDYSVVVASDPVDVPGMDRRVKFVGHHPIDEIMSAYGNAKVVLNCNPTYPNSIHERVYHGMAYGACVLSDRNPATESKFDDRENILFVADQTFKGLADGFGLPGLERIAGAGKSIVLNDAAFSMDSHAKFLMRVGCS